MTFWNGETLLIRLPSLISPFDLARVDINAYTLSMGSEYYCTSDKRRAPWQGAVRRRLAPGADFRIPAGQFGFLQTAETIAVPDDAMAFISIKAGIKFEGLINVSGFHVDPGYSGHLVFSVFNAGSADIVLQQGQPVFLIWYASLNAPTKMLKGPNNSKSISRDLIKGMSREILSMQSLSNEIEKLRFAMRIQYTLFAVAVAIILALITGVLNDTVHDILHPPTKGQPQIKADLNVSVKGIPVSSPTPTNATGDARPKAP